MLASKNRGNNDEKKWTKVHQVIHVTCGCGKPLKINGVYALAGQYGVAQNEIVMDIHVLPHDCLHTPKEDGEEERIEE